MCRVLSYFNYSRSSHVANYTNVFIGDYSGATTVWPVAVLEFDILALMKFLFVAGQGAVRYDCLDSRMDYCCCVMITFHSSRVRCCIDNYDLLRLSLDDLSTLQPPVCHIKDLQNRLSVISNEWLMVSVHLCRGRVYQLSGPEVRSRKHTTYGKLDPPQIFAMHDYSSVIDEADRCVIADEVANLGLPRRLDEDTPCVALA